VERKDVEAALEARKELGPGYDDHVVDALLAKLEERRPAERPERSPLDMRLPLGSIALGVGATAVATSNAGGAGGVGIAIFAWIAIAIVNLVYALRR
jgi:hypothetical protein